LTFLTFKTVKQALTTFLTAFPVKFNLIFGEKSGQFSVRLRDSRVSGFEGFLLFF